MSDLHSRNPDTNPARLSSLIARCFDADVIATELREDGSAELLYPSEAAFCTRFAPKRIAEFAAGRLCARRALAELGITNFALEANADRSPRWPASITGSITHTAGFCASAVALKTRFAGIGIDAERIGRITPDLYRLIFTEVEIAALRALDDKARERAQTVIFSAKEAFYKCQYPLTGAWRNFRDATIILESPGATAAEFVLHAASGTGVIDWGVPLPLRGRFVIEEDLAVTGIVLANFPAATTH